MVFYYFVDFLIFHGFWWSGGTPSASWDDSASDSLNISPKEGMTTRLRRISLHLAFIAPLFAIICNYWQLFAIIGHYWAIIALLLPHYWPLLAAIGRYWSLLLLTRTFRGYLSKAGGFIDIHEIH